MFLRKLAILAKYCDLGPPIFSWILILSKNNCDFRDQHQFPIQKKCLPAAPLKKSRLAPPPNKKGKSIYNYREKCMPLKIVNIYDDTRHMQLYTYTW